MAVDDAAAAQFGTLAAYLKDIGLDSLFTIDGQNNPGGWLWDQLKQGIDTAEELRFALEQTDVFRERFGVIQAQQASAAKGEPTYVMSPAEVLEYENTVKQTMSAAGLPASFYDDPQDFHSLILGNMSPTEVSQRITEAYDYVLSAPPEVRQAFDQFYGVGQGDSQLAAWALDPERTVRDINKATRTAYAAGIGTRFDIDIDRDAATKIADLPISEAGITEGLRSIASMSNVFDEGIGEAVDIAATNEGVDAVFEGSGAAQTALNRRIGQRRAVDARSTGGAVTTQQGVVGAGTA